MAAKKRVILVGRYHIIEPLGILYLLGVAKRLDWDTQVVLVSAFDFGPLFEEIRRAKPDIVGFSIWTGYHLPMFEACDKVRALGISVIIGGPHATFATEQCAEHATWVVKGEGFRNFRRILEGELEPGVHFDDVRMAEGFPMPDRALVYRTYPALGLNPIKSIIASVGCPFKCSYCYAPHYNDLYGGFLLTLRPIDQIIEEAIIMRDRWAPRMVYFQDDIFGFNIPWLREFSKRWRDEVGIPWHCQIRLELTRDEERLDLFREAGCTGITLAIESGNAFLREFVLLRPMPDNLIVEGIQRIRARGFTLRTEQILQVPFSNRRTDLQTLELNNRLNPEIAWTSILSPYGGTNMGRIAKQFGFFDANNDALQDTFFNRSVLRHVRDGIETLEPVVAKALQGKGDNPLLRMRVEPNGRNKAQVYLMRHDPTAREEPVCELKFLSQKENERYRDEGVVLQRLFDWFSRVPKGSELAERFLELPSEAWSWERLGRMTEKHLGDLGYGERMRDWKLQLAHELGVTPDALPRGVAENPFYFCFFPSAAGFARTVIARHAFEQSSFEAELSILGREVRYWLYDHALYRIEGAEEPITVDA